MIQPVRSLRQGGPGHRGQRLALAVARRPSWRAPERGLSAWRGGRINWTTGQRVWTGPKTVAADLSDTDQLPSVLQTVRRRIADPDILVTCRWHQHPRALRTEVTLDDWDQTLALNLSTPFFLAQGLMPAMKKKGWGRIVNFASLQSTPRVPERNCLWREQRRCGTNDAGDGRGMVALRNQCQRHCAGVLCD